MPTNNLYLAVLPLVYTTTGLSDQALTLYGDESLATEFFPDEVDRYLEMFKNRAEKYMMGGHVTGYLFEKHPTKDGRITLRTAECLAACGTAPVMQVDKRYHENLTTQEVDRILDKINSHGFASLTAQEKRVLDEARESLSRR